MQEFKFCQFAFHSSTLFIFEYRVNFWSKIKHYFPCPGISWCDRKLTLRLVTHLRNLKWLKTSCSWERDIVSYTHLAQLTYWHSLLCHCLSSTGPNNKFILFSLVSTVNNLSRSSKILKRNNNTSNRIT